MVWLELQRSVKKGHTAGCWYGIVLCYFHFPWISDKYSFEKLGQKGTVSQLIRQLTGHELNFVEGCIGKEGKTETMRGIEGSQNSVPLYMGTE